MGENSNKRRVNNKFKKAQTYFGIFFFIILIIIFFTYPCLTNIQELILYVFISLTFGFLLYQSIHKFSLEYQQGNIKISATGSVGLFILLLLLKNTIAWKDDACSLKLKTTEVVVNTKKKIGKDITVMEDGEMILIKGNEKKSMQLNSKGQAHFSNLTEGDSIKLEFNYSEPYKLVSPDSIYIIERNKPINVTVRLDGINQVIGTVLYQGLPLKGVIVEALNLVDTTEDNGVFTINVPEEKQQKKYQIFLRKKGFRSRFEIIYPQTKDQQPILIMSK